jgi:hypothetical protein
LFVRRGVLGTLIYSKHQNRTAVVFNFNLWFFRPLTLEKTTNWPYFTSHNNAKKYAMIREMAKLPTARGQPPTNLFFLGRKEGGQQLANGISVPFLITWKLETAAEK